MRGRVSKRASMLVALAALTTYVGGQVGARADHGADNPVFIQQAGNGQGESKPLITGFNLKTVLFDAQSFPLDNTLARSGAQRYYAWGTIDNQAGPTNEQVAVIQSNDGLRWSQPVGVTLENPCLGDVECGTQNAEIPLLVSKYEQFAVVFGRFPSISDDPTPEGDNEKQFAIYYRDPGSDTGNLSGWHAAVSIDGQAFKDRKDLTQDAGNSVVNSACAGTAANCGSTGATDLVYQASGSDSATCAPIWTCRYVMVYGTFNTGGQEFTSLAGSGDGLAWHGHANPIICPGNSSGVTGCAAHAGTSLWDDEVATLTHIRRIPTPNTPPYNTTFVAYYSGGQTPDNACAGGDSGCFSIGVAKSTDGVTFVKAANNPATPHSLLDLVDPSKTRVVDAANATTANRSTLTTAIPLDLGRIDHQPIYFTRTVNTADASRDVFLAYTGAAPGACASTSSTGCPEMRFSSPNAFEGESTLPLDIFFGDTIASTSIKRGVDLSTLQLKVDGVLVGGAQTEESIVNTYAFSGYRTRVRPDSLGPLTDGAHIFSASITDLDGNTTTKTLNFVVDSEAPVTTFDVNGTPTAAPAALVMPGNSLGTFRGTTIDGNGSTTGSPLVELNAIVTNPLGMKKTYALRPVANGSGPIDSVQSDRLWHFSWTVPTLEPSLLVPGSYTVSVLGVDSGLNREAPSATNTFTYLVL